MTSSVRNAAADVEDEIVRRRTRRPALRRVGETSFVFLFFAVVLFAAIPMGANRDWAWGPIAVLLGGLAVWHALGLGIADGHVLRPAERRPLIAVVLCFLAVMAM